MTRRPQDLVVVKALHVFSSNVWMMQSVMVIRSVLSFAVLHATTEVGRTESLCPTV